MASLSTQNEEDVSPENRRIPTRRNRPGIVTQQKRVIRVDFFFSYWIIVWFLVYYFTPIRSDGVISTWIRKHFNPLLALYIAFIENMLVLGWLILSKTTTVWTIIMYLFMLTIMKIIPIYLIQNHPIRWVNDVLVVIGVFCIYNLYLVWNGTNIYEIYKRTISSIHRGRYQTPLFYFLHKWFGA
jgi:hypothetical protein